MKTYLVGGAVRDELLDYPHKEKDWVVVGATPEEMLAVWLWKEQSTVVARSEFYGRMW